MASRRLGLTSSLSSSTLSSHSLAYHPPSPSPLLSPTSLEFLSSTSPPSSSVLPSSKGQRRKQNRKLLAEKQELERIMDPSYLGSSSSRFSSSRCHADPEGYWHDIDYRPFPQIKPESEIKRSFTSLGSSSSSSSSESCDHWAATHQHRRITTNVKGSKSQEPLAYWETFTVPPYTPTTPTTSSLLSDDNEEEDEEEVKSEYEYYSTLKNRTFPRSPSPSSSSSEISYSYIADPIEPASDDEPRVLKKKKKTNLKGGTRGNDNALDNLYSNESPASSSSPSSKLEENENKEEITRREGGGGGVKPEYGTSRSTLKNSKTEKLHEAWVIMSFIARLKVIRAQRWLRKRVLSCP